MSFQVTKLEAIFTQFLEERQAERAELRKTSKIVWLACPLRISTKRKAGTPGMFFLLFVPV